MVGSPHTLVQPIGGSNEAASQRTDLKRFDASQGPRIVGPDGGKAVDLGSIGARFMAWTEETGGGFSLVEHPMPPRRLAAPLHKHSREDEYSFVVEGRMGALLGDDVVYAEVGDLAFKPRDQWHTFWNAGDEPCRILEIISPGGFEHFFDELGAIVEAPEFDPAQLGELGARYGSSSSPTACRGCAKSTGSITRCCTRASPRARSPRSPCSTGSLGPGWQAFLLWVHGQSFGIEDPLRHRDVGFFVFSLPFLIQLSNLLILIVAMGSVLAGVHVHTGAVTRRPLRATHPARVHLALLGGLALLLLARRLHLATFSATQDARPDR